jgi:hypothetical protein
MDHLRHFITVVALAVILLTPLFLLRSCMVEDFRHSEEMKRLQLIEDGCLESE